MQDIGSDVSGVGFRCYQVAELQKGNELSWKLTVDFEDTGIDVDGLDKAADYREAAEVLTASKGKTHAAHTDGKTDVQGIVRFTSLKQGIYLIEQTQTGKYGTVEPFLAAIPYMTDGEEWIYDVHTNTKGERLQEKEGPQTPDKNVKVKNVKTGDDAMMERHAVIAGIAGIVVIVIGAVRYHRGRKTEA